jgi:UDP-N-acetylenolpyruvoylglucosamine reductase
MTKIILECNDVEIIVLNTVNVPRIGETISVKEKKEITKYKVKSIDYRYKTSGFSDGYHNDVITLQVEFVVKNKPLECYDYSLQQPF